MRSRGQLRGIALRQLPWFAEASALTLLSARSICIGWPGTPGCPPQVFRTLKMLTGRLRLDSGNARRPDENRPALANLAFHGQPLPL